MAAAFSGALASRGAIRNHSNKQEQKSDNRKDGAASKLYPVPECEGHAWLRILPALCTCAPLYPVGASAAEVDDGSAPSVSVWRGNYGAGRLKSASAASAGLKANP
jgi:hypothetical protein